MKLDPRSPRASSRAVQAVMKGNRGRDTSPERALRSELHRRGLRFRKHARPLTSVRCHADVIFPKELCAVFVDGCFWHGCPLHGHVPKKNSAYWASKFDRNRHRDKRNNELLGEAGWLVIRAWEHVPIEDVANRIEQAVKLRRA